MIILSCYAPVDLQRFKVPVLAEEHFKIFLLDILKETACTSHGLQGNHHLQPCLYLSHLYVTDMLQSVLRDIQRQSRTSIASSGLLEYKDERSWTPLLLACARGHYKCAELVSISRWI
jgi:hypothetical protein